MIIICYLDAGIPYVYEIVPVTVVGGGDSYNSTFFTAELCE